MNKFELPGFDYIFLDNVWEPAEVTPVGPSVVEPFLVETHKRQKKSKLNPHSQIYSVIHHYNTC